MKSIVSDMFLGLTKIKMGRVRFFVYQVLLLVIGAVITRLLDMLSEDSSLLNLIILIVALLIVTFCTLNTTAKRVRDIGTSKPWGLTIALLIIASITLRNIDDEYLILTVDLLLILFLTALPKDFIDNFR